MPIQRKHAPTPSPPDEVDALVAAWSRERPDLDPSPLEVLSRVARLARHLDLERTSAFAAQGLAPWEFDVLSALRRAGDPFTLSARALAREALVSSGTMTNRLDRLAARGFLRRLPNPEDRRGVLIRLTAAGRRRADEAIGDLLVRERPLLDSLDRAQRSELADLLRRVLAPLDGGPDGPSA